MRPRIGELVTVRWPAAEVAALDLRLGGHRCPDSDLDPAALPLAHPAEHRHDQVVSFGLRVDRSADLGHPQLHSVVGEHREGEPVLVAVERALRLADHDRIKATVRILQLLQ